MTEAVKKAVDDLVKTVQQIRESSSPAPVYYQDGDFFTFTTPGVAPDERPIIPTAPPSPDSNR
jgi:hypothetical protein